MPLDKLVLILVCVMAAAGATVWLGATLAAATNIPLVGPLGLIPAALVVYVVWRIVADRLNNAEDDHYDRIEK